MTAPGHSRHSRHPGVSGSPKSGHSANARVLGVHALELAQLSGVAGSRSAVRARAIRTFPRRKIGTAPAVQKMAL